MNIVLSALLLWFDVLYLVVFRTCGDQNIKNNVFGAKVIMQQSMMPRQIAFL